MTEVTLIGMGASAATLTQEGYAALRAARRVAGARRLLDALPPAVTADRVPAVRCADVLAALQGAEGPVAALYSGDTGFYSGADGLVELLRRQGIPFRVLPGLSSVQLLAARLGRPWQDWRLVSAHGVPCDPVQAVCGGRPVLFLTGTGEGSPRALCARLAAAGLAGLPVTVGENLACPGEKITQGTAGQLAETAFGPLAVLLAEAAPRAPRRAPGWPDEAFARADGIPMTKQAVRAQILAGLAVKPGDTAWDVGAGTGSVSIELAFANGGAPVYAVECLPEACALIRDNCRRHGAWNVRVVEGTAPEALEQLPAPDLVFVGGSRGHLAPILDRALAANPAVRLCISAIALETLAAAIAALTSRGLQAHVTQIAAAHAPGTGRLHLLRGENPVFLITAGK